MPVRVARVASRLPQRLHEIRPSTCPHTCGPPAQERGAATAAAASLCQPRHSAVRYTEKMEAQEVARLASRLPQRHRQKTARLASRLPQRCRDALHLEPCHSHRGAIRQPKLDRVVREDSSRAIGKPLATATPLRRRQQIARLASRLPQRCRQEPQPSRRLLWCRRQEGRLRRASRSSEQHHSR